MNTLYYKADTQQCINCNRNKMIKYFKSIPRKITKIKVLLFYEPSNCFIIKQTPHNALIVIGIS